MNSHTSWPGHGTRPVAGSRFWKRAWPWPYTWCQVPLVYLLRDTAEPTVTVFHSSGKAETLPGLGLPEDVATEIFQRSGKIRQIELALNKRLLLSE